MLADFRITCFTTWARVHVHVHVPVPALSLTHTHINTHTLRIQKLFKLKFFFGRRSPVLFYGIFYKKFKFYRVVLP